VYYDDDGISRGYQRGAYSEIHLKVVRHEGEYDILVDNRGNEQVKTLRMILVDPEGRREEREIEVRKASMSGEIY
jgi:hypothetical protein